MSIFAIALSAAGPTTVPLLLGTLLCHKRAKSIVVVGPQMYVVVPEPPEITGFFLGRLEILKEEQNLLQYGLFQFQDVFLTISTGS